MRNLMKLIVIAIMTALLICTVVSCASAEDRIYTSPAFRLPADRIVEWLSSFREEAEPAEENEPQEAGKEEVLPEETTEAGKEEALPEETTESGGQEPVQETQDTTPEEEAEEPESPKREVRIYSSMGEVVTAEEIIYLTSELRGFDGLEVSYQWQVDRGDGNGWVNVEGATRSKHMFVASKETITYRWRLVVSVDD